MAVNQRVDGAAAGNPRCCPVSASRGDSTREVRRRRVRLRSRDVHEVGPRAPPLSRESKQSQRLLLPVLVLLVLVLPFLLLVELLRRVTYRIQTRAS